MKKLAAIAFPIVVFVACGGPGDPIAFCHDEISTLCTRLYQCNDSTTIQNTLGYTSESDCDSKNEAKNSCATAGCPLGSKYQPDHASTCINEVQSQACGDDALPASCGEVCQ